MESNNISAAIMRRVYYHYAFTIFTHSFFWQGVFLSVAAGLLAHWLHVASILHNFLSVPVGSVPTYLANSFLGAITNGEILTALVLILAGLVAVRMGYQLAGIAAKSGVRLSQQ